MLQQTQETIGRLSPSARVLVVDDSAVIRGFLRRFLEEATDVRVAATAINGEQAVREVEKQQFDVVVLDIEMPEMDGLTALPLILEKDPDVHVIMASTLTQKSAAVTFQALELGATECLAKPSSARDLAGTEEFKRDLVTKARELAFLTRKKRQDDAGVPTVSAVTKPNSETKAKLTLRPFPVAFNPEVIAISSSTGGPKALTDIFTALRGLQLRKPVFITQHMPEKFTTILAQNLEKYSGFTCHEPVDGEEVKAGVVYVAPGNYHMLCRKQGDKTVIRLDQGPAESFCRPASDPMLRSLTTAYGGHKILGVVLTGMGQDSLEGSRALVDDGGVVVAQDEDTSVVWGMPGAVAEGGLCSKILPLEKIADYLKKYL